MNHGGDGIRVECPPIGSNPIPEEAGLRTQHCFVSSYIPSTRSQIISLRDLNIETWIMDILRPEIYISEWLVEGVDLIKLVDLEHVILRFIQDEWCDFIKKKVCSYPFLHMFIILVSVFSFYDFFHILLDSLHQTHRYSLANIFQLLYFFLAHLYPLQLILTTN